jgi:N-acyl-L-homoserine lactone synthetase
MVKRGYRITCSGMAYLSIDGMASSELSRLQYDQFDTPAATYIVWLDGEGSVRGAARLIPTTQPYMVNTLWLELIDGDVPQTDQTWEATRFVCDRNLNSETRRRIVAELICGCQKFGIARGISSYLGVMPVGIFRHVIAAAGCPVTLRGPPSAWGTMILRPPTSMCRQRHSRWSNSAVPSAAAQAKWAKRCGDV